MSNFEVNKSKLRVGVVGGGIIGISSALAIAQRIPNVCISVIAESFTPHTTGDGAAGLWMPFLLGKSLKQHTSELASKTFTFLRDLYLSEAGEAGVSLTTGYVFDYDMNENIFWKDMVFGFGPMSTNELNLVGATNSRGYKFTTFITECTKMLPFLMRKLEAHGVTFIKRKLDSINDILNDYEVVINCPGVMASLEDADVQPVRGQIIRVSAPWINMFFVNDNNYIIPNSKWVVLGGTHQRGNWNRKPNDEDRKHIMDGCTRILPSIKKARVIDEWVGLRPGRSQVRLEAQKIKEKPLKLVVHNYGHGGSGVTVFWGCAQQVANLIEQAFNEPKSSCL